MGPCQQGMARPQVANGKKAARYVNIWNTTGKVNPYRNTQCFFMRSLLLCVPNALS